MALARQQGVTLYAALLAVQSALLERLSGETGLRIGAPAVVYFHPWELDREQPYRALSPFLFARHHGRRAVTEPRMRALLAAHRFESLAGASA